MKKALIVFSGGQDSTTCLYWALEQGWVVHTLTFSYGQRHSIELEAAKKIQDRAGLPAENRHLVEIPAGVLKTSSPLMTLGKLKEYEDCLSLPEKGVEDTFIPFRNQLMLTIAANHAASIGATEIVTGVSQEDSGGYPDCRRNFIDSLQLTSNLSSMEAFPPLTIHTPLMYKTKAETVEEAWFMPECYAALAWSHTAYDGQFPPIGKDHATLLREKGFLEAGLPDPLVLRAHAEGLMELPETTNYHKEILDQVYPVLEDYAWLEVPL